MTGSLRLKPSGDQMEAKGVLFEDLKYQAASAKSPVGIVTILASWATTYFYLMGVKPFGSTSAVEGNLRRNNQ